MSDTITRCNIFLEIWVAPPPDTRWVGPLWSPLTPLALGFGMGNEKKIAHPSRGELCGSFGPLDPLGPLDLGHSSYLITKY